MGQEEGPRGRAPGIGRALICTSAALAHTVAHLAVGRVGKLHLMVDVARGHALEELAEDLVSVLKALRVLSLAHAVVAVLVLLRAQLAPAEMVDEVHLHSVHRTL